MIEEQIKKIIQQNFKQVFKLDNLNIELAVPEVRFGDFSLSCHKFASQLKISPNEIASKLSENISDNLIVKTEAVAGYLNIFLNPKQFNKEILSEALSAKSKKSAKEKVLLEYSSPNTNKPLHFGHIRNNFLGMAIAGIMEQQGKDVIKTQITNDRGIHIAKAMVAYKEWGKDSSPEKAGEKGDHFVGKFYLMFDKEFKKEWEEFSKSNPEIPGLSKEDHEKRKQEFFSESNIGQKAQDVLRLWEAGDKATKGLWLTMRNWVLNGFSQTYKNLGSEFDKEYFESDTYILGNKIVDKGLKDGVFFKEDDKSIWIDLTDQNLDKKILRRKDGTSVYITQDLGLALKRHDEFGFNSAVYVVGHEQEYHFNVLFASLKKMGYSWANKLYHLSYGLLMGDKGKISSRQGARSADDIIDEIISLAAQEVKKRNPNLPKEQVDSRASIIGMGALKFFLLKINPSQFIKYKAQEAIAFEGDTGPYVQYSYARISGILEQETAASPKNIDLSLLSSLEERQIILRLSLYQKVLQNASSELNPSLLCNYLLSLSQDFNAFYHKHKVLKANTEEQKQARLILIKAVQTVLANGLSLLGIGAPEKM